jgi:cobalt transporter subunit CbtA
MTALRSMLFVAVLAGLAAGVAMTVLQLFATVPLIHEAEAFEAAAAGAGPAHDHALPAAHDHADAEWAPADGVQRTGLTAVANLVTAIGFGLLLVAVSEAAGGIRGWRRGLVWGLAGFATFTLAPGLGLPPELPAMPAAELAPRQAWWLLTALATGAGLALIAFGRTPWLGFAGAALLVLPHLVGAPQPPGHDSPIPPDLHHRFVVAVTVTSLVFWLLLGAAVSLVRPRFADGLGGAPRPRLA